MPEALRGSSFTNSMTRGCLDRARIAVATGKELVLEMRCRLCDGIDIQDDDRRRRLAPAFARFTDNRDIANSRMPQQND